MAFSEKIRLIFDIDDKAAVGSFGRIGKSINDADGARGKFGAGLKSTGTFLKANMAEAATAAGAALVAFGVSSIKAFQDTALAASKFSDATGLAVDDVSRLMEVSGDLGIDVGSLQGAMQRFNREVGAGKVDLKQFGSDLVYAKDGSVDAYESFINAATAIGAIEDPTKRAQAAQATFGKSYGEIAELMELDADELRTALGEVSEAKVIDKEEVQKAKDMRAALDTMKDTVEDVQLQFGELLVSVAPTLEAIMKGIGFAAEELANFYEWQEKIVMLAAGDDGFRKLAGNATFLELAAKDTGAELDDLDLSTQRVEKAARKLDETWGNLKAEVDDDKAFFDIQGTFIDLQTTAEEAWIATAEGAEGAEEKAREYTGALLDAKGEVIDYLSEVLKLPPERSTKILAAFDEGNMQFVEDQLAILSRNRTMSLSILAKGGTGNITVNGRGFGVGATGGIVTQPTMALIGEAGPEAVVPLSQMPGASPLPSGLGSGSSSGGGDRSINIYTQANPNDVVAAIKQYERLNGRGWRS